MAVKRKQCAAAIVALCSAVVHVAVVGVAACVGVPNGPNKHVCVRLSEAAAASCGPTGWPLPSGPAQGFWYETDDGSGSRSGVDQWRARANFTIDTSGGTITFELVARDGSSTDPYHDATTGFGCHPFAIISRSALRGTGGGCSRSGVSCAYGAQAGVAGPVPAYLTGQRVTLTAEINATYGWQSLDDTFMGGEIVVTNQLSATPGGGDNSGSDGAGDDDGAHSESVRRGAMIAAIVIGISAFVLLPLGLGLRYARHHGHWTGCCVWKRNPNLAASAAGSAASDASGTAATAPAATLSEVALDVHSSGSASASADVAHVQLREDMPAVASDAPATHAVGAGAGTGAAVDGSMR